MDRIEIAGRSDAEARRGHRDGVQRPRAAPASRGLERHFIINIDHHAGNRMYGALNWFDESAAACGEMVFDVIRALGVPLTPRDRHPHLPRDPHRHRLVPPLEHHAAHVRHLPPDRRGGREPGGDGAARVRQQQLRQAEADRRAARRDGARSTTAGSPCCTWTTRCSTACGCTHNDTEGLINLPLTAREIQAVVFFKVVADGDVRVSMRSKYDVDVRVVANELRRRRPQERRRLHRRPAPLASSVAKPARCIETGIVHARFADGERLRRSAGPSRQ